MLKDLFQKFSSKNSKVLVIIILIPILLIFFLIAIKGCSGKMNYEKYEKKMISAAEKYFKNNNTFPKIINDKVEVSLDKLIENGNIKSTDKALKDTTCSGNVTVVNIGEEYFYVPYLKCDKHTTSYLIDKLLEDVVTEKSGLYKVDDGYVYKGAKVNNYLKFFGKMYRIISIDNDGIIKMVKSDKESKGVYWDSKFNSQINKSYGKNDYADSNIYDVLTNLYNDTSSDRKKHFFPRNVCVGTRSKKYSNVDKVNECSKMLDNQYFTLLNVYDYPMASYDVDCVSIYSGACSNYNYMRSFLTNSWLINGVSDNTYDVFYYSGYINSTKANTSKSYYLVTFVSGNELYTKGDGSKDNPYIIN